MDFIDGLPNSRGKSTIFVIVDRLSKYAHFLTLSHPYTTVGVAQVFFDNVFKLHGMPKSIVCDRDPTFTSQFWKDFLIFKAPVLISVRHTTLKRMGKPKW